MSEAVQTADSRKLGAWEWTEWPTLPMPSEAGIVKLAQTKGARAVDDFHRERELAIANEKHDPLHFGWESPPILAARKLLAGTYVPGEFGPVASSFGWSHDPTIIHTPLPAADDLLLMTGNRFGKSNFGGRLANEKLKSVKNARVRCWSQSEETSRSIQQTFVYKFLPPNLRKVKRAGQFTKISYSAATGFTEGTLLYAQQGDSYAQTWFLTYHSWQQDKTIAEGPGVTMTWCDEEVPSELLDTLRYRVGDGVKMVLLVTFTPISGYTDAVGQYIEGARVVECAPARRIVYDWWKRSWSYGDWLLPQDKVLVEGCPPGHLPFILEHTQVSGRYALCAGTGWNPYVNAEEVFNKSVNQPLEIKLIRWFGWPLRKVRPALSFYDAHLVKPGRIPPLSELTIYLVIDPCPPPRNWFMVWLGLDRENRVWVLSEWPDRDVGEWAVPGTDPDGKVGPGAYDGGGRGFDGYKLLILERQGWTEGKDGVWAAGPQAVKVADADTLLDPRAASWKVPSQDEADALDYLQLLYEPVMRVKDGARRKVAPGIDAVRAPACHIQEGNELINDWMTQGWNPKERLDPMNAPRFYINAGVAEGEDKSGVHPFLVAGCSNTIWSLRTFTGKKKSGATDENSACKDPIDCLKYAAKANVRHVAAGSFGAYGRAGSGY